MIRALCFYLLLGVQVTAVPLQIHDFSAIDQRSIEGASGRCGTVALGSWLLWLGTHGTPELLSTDPPIDGNPFARAALPAAARSTLSQLDATCGGTQEIKLLRMIEGLVDYFHWQPTESLELTLRYRLNVYAAQDPETAQMLKIRTGPSFVKPGEVILVEGALALWLERISVNVVESL